MSPLEVPEAWIESLRCRDGGAETRRLEASCNGLIRNLSIMCGRNPAEMTAAVRVLEAFTKKDDRR